jgi:hypothetical protein
MLSGHAIDTSGIAVANVVLTLTPSDTDAAAQREAYDATTNSNGEFTFQHLDGGDYQLTSSNSGYQVATPKQVSVDPQQTISPLTVKIFPVTLISGRVLDEFGSGLSNVEIIARSPYADEGTLSKTRSNNRGYFEFEGMHQSEVAYQNFNMAMAFVESVVGRRAFEGDICIDIYHPQHQHQTLALTTDSAALDLGEIRLQTPNLPIRGQVLNYRDQPIAATLHFTNLADQDSKILETRLPRCDDIQFDRTVQTDSNGEFELNLDTRGRYNVEVETDYYKKRQFNLDIDGDDLVIKLN